jgi:hypothetical protein
MFFDHSYTRGPQWYLSHFPPGLKDRQISGESTPGYLVYSKVSRRLADLLPTARIIVVLRDPVERAWSAYRYHYARQAEEARNSMSSVISFDDFVAMEMSHLEACLGSEYPTDGDPSLGRGMDLHGECYTMTLEEQLQPAVIKWHQAHNSLPAADSDSDSDGTSGGEPSATRRRVSCLGDCRVMLSPPGSNMLCARSLLGRGLYAQSLHRYYIDRGPDSIHVVCTEDLSPTRGVEELGRVGSFLGLRVGHDFGPGIGKGRFNVGGVHSDQYGKVTRWEEAGGGSRSSYGGVNLEEPSTHAQMSASTRIKLREWFAPHNEKLFRLIGKRCRWPGA